MPLDQQRPRGMAAEMNQIIEGLVVVEVIADDFLICGFAEALANHDVNIQSFLDRAREHGIL